MAEAAPVPAAIDLPFRLHCHRPWLVATFARPQRMVSWALHRPGSICASRVAWREVGDRELVGIEEPAAWFGARLGEAGLADAVGLLTARNVACHEQESVRVEGIRADCVITLGLNNGETVGQRRHPQSGGFRAGTINILARVSVPLTDPALLEMAAMVTQARTAALLRFGFRLPGMEEIVTGTGTDCIVAACPQGEAPQSFAGMHTAIGEAVGACIHAATLRAAESWLASWPGRAG